VQIEKYTSIFITKAGVWQMEDKNIFYCII